MEKSSNIDMFSTGSLDETNYTWQRSTEDRKVQKLKAWGKKKKPQRQRRKVCLLQQHFQRFLLLLNPSNYCFRLKNAYPKAIKVSPYTLNCWSRVLLWNQRSTENRQSREVHLEEVHSTQDMWEQNTDKQHSNTTIKITTSSHLCGVGDTLYALMSHQCMLSSDLLPQYLLLHFTDFQMIFSGFSFHAGVLERRNNNT